MLTGTALLLTCGLATGLWSAEEEFHWGNFQPLSFSAEEAIEDVDLLRRALEVIHPGYDRYASRADIDSALDGLEDGVAGGSTDVDLYREISLAVATIRCGHTRVELPTRIEEYRRRKPTHLPFRFRLIQNKMIVDVVHPSISSLRRGHEVLSINAVSGSALMDRISATVPVDGYTDFIRPSRLDTAYEFSDCGFDHYLPFFEGFRDQFDLVMKDTDTGEARHAKVPAITLQEWIDLAPGGARDFGSSVKIRDLGDAVLLEVGTFVNYRTPVDPDEVFRKIFRDLNANETKHLILDLRQCGGGSGDVAWSLARFLVKEPLRFLPPLVKTTSVGDLRPYLHTWDEAAFNMPKEAFRALPDGWFELKEDAGELPPHPDHFRGRVTVLIGPYNASGSTMLIAKLKDLGRVRLVLEKVLAEPPK